MRTPAPRRARAAGALALAAVLAAATGAAPARAQNLITNGGFEDGDFGGSSSFRRLAPGSTALTGWSIGGVAVDWHNAVEMRFPHGGDKVLDLHLDGGAGQQGTISQSFATLPGEAYVLRLFLAGPGANFGFPDPRAVLVDVAGIQRTFTTPASLNTNMQWGAHRLVFTAVDATTTLRFSSPANGAGFWGPVLDDVSVTAVVPEPSSLALLGVGVAGLGAAARRRRRRGLA